ncbi:MAG: LPXTG cell wall anchor domain-containing protein [Thermoplasmata archaeon]
MFGLVLLALAGFILRRNREKQVV